MKTENTTLFLYQRMVEKKDKSGKFPKDKASYEDVSFDANYTKACHEKLTADMLKNGIKFPITMTLTDDMYFTKPVKFVRNDNSEGVKSILIIKDYISIEQAEFRKGDSLHDLAEAIKAGRDAMAETTEE